MNRYLFMTLNCTHVVLTNLLFEIIMVQDVVIIAYMVFTRSYRRCFCLVFEFSTAFIVLTVCLPVVYDFIINKLPSVL